MTRQNTYSSFLSHTSRGRMVFWESRRQLTCLFETRRMILQTDRQTFQQPDPDVSMDDIHEAGFSLFLPLSESDSSESRVRACVADNQLLCNLPALNQIFEKKRLLLKRGAYDLVTGFTSSYFLMFPWNLGPGLSPVRLQDVHHYCKHCFSTGGI